MKPLSLCVFFFIYIQLEFHLLHLVTVIIVSEIKVKPVISLINLWFGQQYKILCSSRRHVEIIWLDVSLLDGWGIFLLSGTDRPAKYLNALELSFINMR